MIYLDNAATTHYKPPEVVSTALECMTTNCFSANRSGHRGAMSVSKKVFDTRTNVAELVNASSSENVVFGLNCTHALNMGILGSVRRNGHIITTANEHNSIIRPLMELRKRGVVELTLLTPDTNGLISVEQVSKAIKNNTYMVVLGHVNNVTGVTQDIENIGRLLQPYHILFLVDGAQSIGYIPIDMQKQCISILCFPAHKGLHGLQGCGVMCFDNQFKPQSIMYGGTGSDSTNLYQPTTAPEGLEVGTLNAPGVVSLSSAIDWWIKTRRDNLPNIDNMQKLVHAQIAQIDKCRVYSVINHSGIVSFEIDGVDSQTVSQLLDDNYDIATRSGLHCAPLTHKHLLTDKLGLTRISLSGENTMQECYTLLNAIEKIAKESN
ncbi:MAG: aminotransferase class V-fold PLP-dependent enzyme [Clostridia bacterium]|nr:aminotransferase class V-fold PLP-dependent enzyme [Clostridia bacterium]